jgi:hypothetical protein
MAAAIRARQRKQASVSVIRAKAKVAKVGGQHLLYLDMKAKTWGGADRFIAWLTKHHPAQPAELNRLMGALSDSFKAYTAMRAAGIGSPQHEPQLTAGTAEEEDSSDGQAQQEPASDSPGEGGGNTQRAAVRSGRGAARSIRFTDGLPLPTTTAEVKQWLEGGSLGRLRREQLVSLMKQVFNVHQAVGTKEELLRYIKDVVISRYRQKLIGEHCWVRCSRQFSQHRTVSCEASS